MSPVVLTLRDGSHVHLDRRYGEREIADAVNAARGKGQLIPFDNNATPSRTVHVDPDEVTVVRHDGHNY